MSGPSQAVAHLLRTRRKELGLKLRQVEEETSKLGQVVPISTLSKIERARLEPGQQRLGTLLRVYGIPYQVVGDLVEIESCGAGTLPDETQPDRLYREGVSCWKKGDFRRGLACLLALRVQTRSAGKPSVDHQKALLAFAIMAAGLGKYRLSREILDELFLGSPDESLLVQTLVHAGVTWNGLGSPEVALSFLERAERLVSAETRQQKAWVLHEMSTTLRHANRLDDARRTLRAALRYYREADDAYGEILALGSEVKLCFARGDAEKALAAARSARRLAEGDDHHRLAILRRLDEGRALAALGDGEKSEEVLALTMSEALRLGDKAVLFFCHYNRFKAFESLGDLERAGIELEGARYFVRFLDGVSEEADEIRSSPRSGGEQP